jgi:hypothetical protein
MLQIALTAEQVELLHAAHGPIQLVDPAGIPVADAVPRVSRYFTMEQLQAAECDVATHVSGPTTTEILARLRSDQPG